MKVTESIEPKPRGFLP